MAKLTVPIIVKWDDIEEDLAKGNIVKVVRCKDCIKNSICINYRYAQDEEGFCAWAERKSE